jgi:transposase
MSSVLSEEKRQAVLALGRLGWPLRRIETETGVRRETASSYLKAAGISVREPGGWGRRPKPANEVSPDSSKPANEVSPDPAVRQEEPPTPGVSPTASACEPYRELVLAALEKGRNAKAIWQDLVDDHGFAARYASVKRFVRQLRGSSPPDAHGVITTSAGEEAQVDYGTGPMVRHPETGEFRRTRLFVMTLGCSRKAVRLLTFKSSTRIWAELHEEAFRRLGASPKVVVLDNLREGVLKPDVYDPVLNPLYRDVLKHYDVTALPCRVRDPDRKGKVESGIGHAQKTPLKGLRFESLAEAQAYLDRWEERWGDTRIHGTTKRQVAVMFAEERAFLQPLPVEPFRYYEFGERTVHLDGCVEVAGAYYEAPVLIGTQLPVRWDERVVRILDPRTGQLLIEHQRTRRGHHRIREKSRARRSPPQLLEVLARADLAGKNVGGVCGAIHRAEGDYGIRRILGVLSLAKKHGAPALDDACKTALEVGVPTYRFLRRYLERTTLEKLSLKQVDPLIRELTHYRDLINQRTGQETS